MGGSILTFDFKIQFCTKLGVVSNKISTLTGIFDTYDLAVLSPKIWFTYYKLLLKIL